MKRLEDFNIKSQKLWEVEEVEWRQVRLRDVAKVVGGSTAPQNKKFFENGKYLFVRVSDLRAKKNFHPIMNTRDKLNEEGIIKNKLVLVPQDTVVFPKSGAAILTNSRGILGKEAYIVNHLAGVIPLKGKTLPRYLLFYLSKIDMSKYISPDSSYPSLKLETIKNLKLPIPFRNGKPDLETQRKIVEYIEANFSRIDKILEKKKQELEKLDELWESVLEQAFKPKEGEEWREVRLGEIAKVVSGSTAPQDKKFYKNGKYLFVRVSDLGAKKNFTPLIDTRDKLNEEGIKRNKLVLVPKDTIVFPKSGAAILTNSRGILGKDAFIVNHLAGVIALKNKSNPRYLLFYLSKLDMGKYVSPDSSYPSLKLETIKNLKIPIPFRNNKPDLEKQKEIANYLDGVYEKIKALKEKIQNQRTQLEEMKESILDEVFNHENKESSH